MSGRLTKIKIDQAAPKEMDYFLWDGELKGFGVKICKGGRKAYVCQYRLAGGRAGKSRRYTIGAHGSPWTVDQARVKAKQILGQVAQGQDPSELKQEAKKEITVSELCDLYLKHGIGSKKDSTISTDRGRIERHIKPLIGRKKVREINRAEINKFLNAVAMGKTAVDQKTGLRGRAIVTGGKGTASRTLGLLGGIFTYAIDLGMLTSNPVHGVKKYPGKKSERFLSHDEFIRLGKALDDCQKRGLNLKALTIVKLLIFTGARKGEIETLKWESVDFSAGFLRFFDSKTGQKSVPMNSNAVDILAKFPRSEFSQFVFPAESGAGYYTGTTKVWRILRNNAKLQDVRLHDLRHSFASIAVSEGASLPMIGALLGHSNSETTLRYAHLQDDPLKAVSENIASTIGKAIKG
ncbi:MAG: tyrosine-type recombinase/integrase [Opitutales bacterium]